MKEKCSHCNKVLGWGDPEHRALFACIHSLCANKIANFVSLFKRYSNFLHAMGETPLQKKKSLSIFCAPWQLLKRMRLFVSIENETLLIFFMQTRHYFCTSPVEFESQNKDSECQENQNIIILITGKNTTILHNWITETGRNKIHFHIKIGYQNCSCCCSFGRKTTEKIQYFHNNMTSMWYDFTR